MGRGGLRTVGCAWLWRPNGELLSHVLLNKKRFCADCRSPTISHIIHRNDKVKANICRIDRTGRDWPKKHRDGSHHRTTVYKYESLRSDSHRSLQQKLDCTSPRRLQCHPTRTRSVRTNICSERLLAMLARRATTDSVSDSQLAMALSPKSAYYCRVE